MFVSKLFLAHSTLFHHKIRNLYGTDLSVKKCFIQKKNLMNVAKSLYREASFFLLIKHKKHIMYWELQSTAISFPHPKVSCNTIELTPIDVLAILVTMLYLNVALDVWPRHPHYSYCCSSSPTLKWAIVPPLHLPNVTLCRSLPYFHQNLDFLYTVHAAKLRS